MTMPITTCGAVCLLVVGLAACTPRRVETLPDRCREGTVVIKGGPECEARCTCRADDKWSCQEQPCAFAAPPSDSRPRLQDAAGNLVAAPVDAGPAPPDARREGPETATTERVDGPYRRSFAADGTLRWQDFYHMGRPALRCRPTSVPGELTCRPQRGGVPLDPACWKDARLPRAGVQVLATKPAFARVFRCKELPAIEWSHARLVLVNQRLAPAEKLEIVVRQRRGATELVARIRTRCSGVRQFDRGPAVHHHELVALPKDGGKLSVRIERVPSSCGQVP
jgi:hypothetical protein